ncbi:MAG TPA: adenylosuccinate synthetase, partial [bacterium]|nr:adenylosuccinate synthetase [bacterium]
IYDQPAVRIGEFWEELSAAREVVVPMITDTATELIDALDREESVIAEGAQGVLLDIDFGTYPYVTSSHPGSLGVSAGLGIPSEAVTRRTGIFKAYCTRVGEGPFPTEIREQEQRRRLREVGDEYGATTGRPRRCGWFDAVLGRFAARVNGFTDICITKADVLSEFDEIKLCTGYQEHQTSFLNLHALESAYPVYESFPGWTDDISAYDSYRDLPGSLREYLDQLQSHLQAPIRMISTGPERSQIIVR